MTTNRDWSDGYNRVRLPDAIAEGAWFEQPWSGLYGLGWGRSPSDVNKIPANHQRVDRITPTHFTPLADLKHNKLTGESNASK